MLSTLFSHVVSENVSTSSTKFWFEPRTLGMRFREIKCRVGVGIFCNHIIYFRTMDIVQSKEPRKLLSSSPIRGWQWQWQWLYFPYWNNTASILCCYNLHLGGRLRKLSQAFTKCISVYNFSAQYHAWFGKQCILNFRDVAVRQEIYSYLVICNSQVRSG